MKKEVREVFIAFDGTPFEGANECRAYEKESAHKMLVGLTSDQIAAALSREDSDLADAIERVGFQIATARRASGDVRRKRAPFETSEAPEPTEEAEASAAAE